MVTIHAEGNGTHTREQVSPECKGLIGLSPMVSKKVTNTHLDRMHIKVLSTPAAFDTFCGRIAGHGKPAASMVPGMRTEGRGQEDSDLHGRIALASGADGDVLGGRPGAAAIRGGHCEGANLAGTWGVQECLEEEHHTPIVQVLLAHRGLYTRQDMSARHDNAKQRPLCMHMCSLMLKTTSLSFPKADACQMST